MLDRRIKAYQRRGESMSYIDTQNLLPQMKTYLPWLAEVDSQALKYSCRQLNNAYKGFFEDGKGFPNSNENGEKKAIQLQKQKALKLTISTFSFRHLGRCVIVRVATLRDASVRQQSVAQQAANTM